MIEAVEERLLPTKVSSNGHHEGGMDHWWERAESTEEIASAIIQVSQMIEGWEYVRWYLAWKEYERRGQEGIKELGRRCRRGYSTLMAWRAAYIRYLGPNADSEISEELTPSHHIKVVAAENPNGWLEIAARENLNPIQLHERYRHEEEHGGKAEVIETPQVCPHCGAEEWHWASNPFGSDA